ncbi:hypothetical protein N1851_006719 [Merluccius polli]|uniref:Reverse transcriptase n=1 Tax=Merluccius polli TaxID=89951 RepID=A0AA47N4V1_MERPO|nr:hypothetical protein N1851_006719 [Merluccius polli]
MLLTETWLQDGECTPFSELLPPDCLFISSPRSTGRGGGLASVFKSSFQCRQSPSDTYSSFELQMFELHLSSPVMFAVIYRPPKFNKGFINDFADFLSRVTVNYDYLLISGDFNIHVCCESRPLVNDFLNLLASFNLVQSVRAPTHEKGHTLDLVLSYGLSVCINEICETACISDHLPVLFTVSIPCSRAKTCVFSRRLRTINPQTATKFSAMYTATRTSGLMFNTLEDNDTPCVDELLSTFNSTCTVILDLVAPFKLKRTKALSEPWLNYSTCALRHSCRCAERKWKKDKLHVSKQALQESLSTYQSAVRAAKIEYFSNLVSINYRKPQVLFNIFNSLVNTCDNSPVNPSSKISALRPPAPTFVAPGSTATGSDPIAPLLTAVFDQFEPISLSSLSEVVTQLRPTNCPSDSIPSRLLKEVFSSVGSSILLLINTCLSTGSRGIYFNLSPSHFWSPPRIHFRTLLECLHDVKSWMAKNFLNLNDNKTEIIMFGCNPSDLPANFLGPLTPNVRSSAKNLGVTFDSNFRFNKQVSTVVKNSFFYLRTLSKVKGYLSRRDLEIVIHALINSRLDYCNSLYVGLDQSLLYRLQLVQNAAARLLTGKRKRDHISPVLASLHWLPVSFRIDFKILLFVFKALNGLAPQYLSELLHIYAPARALRSTNQLLLVVPKTRLSTKGDRAFGAAAPRLWNSLPWHIRSAGSIEVFKSSLKTHLFSQAFN